MSQNASVETGKTVKSATFHSAIDALFNKNICLVMRSYAMRIMLHFSRIQLLRIVLFWMHMAVPLAAISAEGAATGNPDTSLQSSNPVALPFEEPPKPWTTVSSKPVSTEPTGQKPITRPQVKTAVSPDGMDQNAATPSQAVSNN